MEAVLQGLLLLLGSEAELPLAEFAAETATDVVKGYCGIEDIPAELYHGMRPGEAEIKGVSFGDTSYTLTAPVEQMRVWSASPSFLQDWAVQLAPFRRLTW